MASLIDYLKNKQHIYEDLLIANKLDEKTSLHIKTELGITEELLKELHRSNARQGIIEWMTKKVSDNPEDFLVTINDQIEKDVAIAMSNVEGTPTEQSEAPVNEEVSEVNEEDIALPEINVPPAQPEQEDYHDKYTAFKFDFNNEWINLVTDEIKTMVLRLME